MIKKMFDSIKKYILAYRKYQYIQSEMRGLIKWKFGNSASKIQKSRANELGKVLFNASRIVKKEVEDESIKKEKIFYNSLTVDIAKIFDKHYSAKFSEEIAIEKAKWERRYVTKCEKLKNQKLK